MAHYAHAPITEATIDIQARLDGGVSAESLLSIPDNCANEFPTKIELRRRRVEVHLGPGVEQQVADSSDQAAGWAFRSADEKRVIQSRLDGFSFARLAPYDRWESLRDEAKVLWERYRTIASPQAITRAGIKYVNRFDIPLPINDLKDFFRTCIQISSDMPQGLLGFFSQVQIPYPDLEIMLVLTQTLVPPPQAGLVSVVLDIELFKFNNVPSDDQALWQLFEKLRELKNQVFEACITDAARELIR